MASLLDMCSDDSDSEDDCDYIPPTGEISEDSDYNESCDDDLQDSENVKKAKGKKKQTATIEKNDNDAEKETKSEMTAEEEKKKADQLWKAFKMDVDHIGKKPVATPSAISDDKSKSSNTLNLSAKTTITEIYDFAGEQIKVTREIDMKDTKVNSEVNKKVDARNARAWSEVCKEIDMKNRKADNEATQKIVMNNVKTDSLTSSLMNRPCSTSANLPTTNISKRPVSGLASALSAISKKPKMSTLQKSAYDWNNFKRAEGIEEELKSHNRGKDGYLEKQAFLERTDLRQFEIEKKLRDIGRKKRANVM